MQKYKPCKLSKSVRRRCGHLFQKTEGFFAGRDSSPKKPQQYCLQELEVGDCWIGLSVADSRGLILAAPVGKHTDELIEQLVVNTEEKTNCQRLSIRAAMSVSSLPKSNITSAKIKPSDVRVYQRHCPTTNWAMASAAEQVSAKCGIGQKSQIG